MPRKATTNITNVSSVDLTKNFTATTALGTDHTYNVSTDLRLFLRFGAVVTNLASYTSNDTITIAYEAPGSLETSSETVGARTLSSFFAEENKSNSATVTFSGASSPEDNITTFGDGSADSPFSISFWIKYTETPPSGARILFEKGRNSGSVDQEYRLEYNNVGNTMTVRLFDDSSSRQIAKVFGSIDLEDGQFHHIAVTYDGHGSGAHNSTHITLYLDGVDLEANVSARTDNGYTAMEPASDELHIGADNNASTESDAYTAEFAIWGTELTSDNIKAIYYGQFDAIETTIIYNSGYTDLSSRIKIRDMDNRPGCYPTKHRMGDKDRSGKANIFYEDLPIQFGNSIKDDFTKVDQNDLITDAQGFDSTKWSVSNGMTIRREVQNGDDGTVVVDRCATFSGNGTAGKRFIRTAETLRNITRMYFELIQGPYNEGAILLNLRKGNDTETLKIQISTDSAFTSPTTIATYTPDTAFGQFFGEGYEVNTPPRKRVTLSLKDFPDLGQSYYLRFVQETFSSNSKNVWAIPIIEIEYANQNIRYPLLLNHATGHNKFVSASISTPHTDSDLLGIGRAVKGVSDASNPFQSFDETITAFNETLTLDITNNFFRSPGVDPAVYPGFTSPVKSKTKFTIDLSPSEETTFGHTTRLSLPEDPDQSNYVGKIASSGAGDESGNGQNLMVYWNNNLKRWQKIGQPVNFNNHATPSEELLFQNLTQSCLGFARYQLIGEGSGGEPYDLNTVSLYPRDQHALNAKPFDRYFFPFGGQYHATSSQFILAKDIGITKPFLLEKMTIECDLKLELPISSSSTFYSHENLMLFAKYEDNEDVNINGLKAITPTFFLLRQFKDNATFKRGIRRKSSLTDVILEYESSIPGRYYLNSGSSVETYVDDNRELITYAQPTFFVTGAHFENGGTGDRSGLGHMNHSVQDLIAAGIGSDENFVISHDHTSGIFSHTASIAVNAPVRNVSKYPRAIINRMNRKLGSFSIKSQAYYYSGKESTSRTDSSLKNSRGIVNGIMSSDPGEITIVELSVTERNTLESPNADTVERQAPYLIEPNDKLVLGWQYPFINRQWYSFGYPGTDSNVFNSMTLFGKSKLHLYGSEIVQNKEYHETVNQNLTSCAVYEHIIGDEKVVDQWQVAYRGELTGSFISNQTFNYTTSFRHNPQAWNYMLGPYIVDDVSTFFPTRGQYKNQSIEHNKGIKRIDLPVISTVGDAKSKIKQYFVSQYGMSDSDAQLIADLIYPFFNAGSLKSFSFFPEGIEYSDGNALLGSFYDNRSNLTQTLGSSYGTLLRNLTDEQGIEINSFAEDASWLVGQGPKYSFSTKHYGYYSDLHRQGLDSKFKVTPRQGFTTGFDIVVNSEPPVEAKLVEKEISEEGIISYIEKPIDYFLNFFYFQSSNLNQYMTSSMPFIDNDTATNRTYVGTEYIGFNAVSVSTLLS